jgi:dienelactone hydrolase
VSGLGESVSLFVYGGDPRIVAERNELLRVALALRSAAATLKQAAALSLERLGPDPTLWPANIGAQVFLAARLPSLHERLDRLAQACDLAAEAYFSTEVQISRNFFESCVLPWQQIDAMVRTPIGFMARPAAGTTAGGVAAALGAAGLVLLPNSGGTGMIRAASALATTLAGATTVPGLLEKLRLNLGLMGVPTTSAAAATLISTGTVTAAGSLAQHAARLQQSYAPGGSIRIEVYQPAGETLTRQFVVYIPGTQSAALAGKMPLDLRSNLKAMAGSGLAASERAVTDALSQLGATKTDRVLLVGHSQGALIANNILRDERLRVTGFISVGGPIAHRPPETTPTIALEHTNDPVPALSGRVNPLTENLATVQRELPAGSLVEAHAMAGYRETAALADASGDPGLVRIRGELARQLEGLGEGVEYRFELSRG